MSETGLVPMQEPFSLAPQNLEQAMQYAKLLADSTVVPQAFQKKPPDILVAVQLGMELGLSPVQALQNIAVINGRPCLWGDAVLALVRASGKLEYIKEFAQDDVAVCELKRKGDPEAVTREFSQLDAEVAGLAKKPGPWQQYPARMRQMRARSWAIRDVFPDVLKGVAVREEVDDYNVVGTTEQGNQIMRRPRRIDEPSASEAKNTETQVDEFLNGDQKAAGVGDRSLREPKVEGRPSSSPASAAPSKNGMEKVGVLGFDDSQKTKKGGDMAKVKLARQDGKTVDAFAFSKHVIEALRLANGASLAVNVKLETKGGDKPYIDVTEAVCDEPGGEEGPE